ncbi:MAG TPA: cupredoxin domain-containing protein [Terracidiphilus sp.]
MNLQCGVIVLNNCGLNQISGGTFERARRRLLRTAKKLIGGGGLAITVLLTLATGPAGTSPRRIEVTAKRFAFEPAEITIKPGESVDLVLTSADVPHGVRFRELNVDLNASKGKPAEAKFTPEKTGTFIGHCSVFCGSGHGKMTLTIHVVD